MGGRTMSQKIYKTPEMQANKLLDQENRLRESLRERWLKIPQDKKLKTAQDWHNTAYIEEDMPEDDILLSENYANNIVDMPEIVDANLLDKFLKERGY